MDHISQWPLLLPPVLAVVEDDALAVLAVFLLKERDLVSETELDELCNLQVALHCSLEIEIIPDTGLHTETNIMESLIGTRAIIFVEQRTSA